MPGTFPVTPFTIAIPGEGDWLILDRFFVNIQQIPPVLRWLRYFSTLGFTLEALAINEVGSGLQIIVRPSLSPLVGRPCLSDVL